MTTQEQTLIAAIIAQLILIVPVAGLVIRNYLTSKLHEKQISVRPTKDEVSTAIDAKVNDILDVNGHMQKG